MKQNRNKNAKGILEISLHKTKKMCLLCSIAILAIFFQASAQTTNTAANSLAINTPAYHTAVGLRGGLTSGLTVKHFTGNASAIEGIFGVWPYGLSVTGLFEHYVRTQPEGLQWYYGGGGHAGFNTGVVYYTSEGRNLYYRDGEVGLGIDGMLGIEYKIPPIPFAISLDLKPFIEVTTMNRVYVALDPGLGIKVTF